ncbi:unnamed protein product [Triticum turgidum subsp. durum]|uniref:Protein SYS1 homolog n=1 Tax=Triticum turgidum subsp. durum TaxID=4567 RepID=A0A9R1QJT7_TRITD|nr:unnamed protein product [Triticum turgidum subsp. durum]
MFYGAMVWDPWLIVAQIVCLQCLYYLGLGLFMALLVGTRVPRLTLLYLFDFATLTPRTTTGWCAIASFLLAAIAASGTWWVVNIVGLAIMSLLGEYLCIRRELKDIPVRLRASV